jgi:putative aldouronate transport system permease protein
VKRSKSIGGIIFDVFNCLFLFLFTLIMVLPIIYVIAGSFTSDAELSVRRIVFIPMSPTLDAYKYIFGSSIIFNSFFNSVFITIVGTAINIFMTALTAYPLSRKSLRGRGIFMKLIVFTMLFQGGLIPTYLLVKSISLLNSYWSLWLTGAISAFNLVILRNFFMTVPFELTESAKIDGCNELYILIKIIIPLSLPSLAALTLFYAVAHWNAYFYALMFIENMRRWPLQVWLRQIVILSQTGIDPNAVAEGYVIPPESTKLAVVCVAVIPILCIYPLLQKYFAKGVLLGSVKG